MSTTPADVQPISHITCIAEPFTTRLLIADILRTRYCIPGSIFLVEGVDVIHASRSKRWRAVRLMLGDGELCIQALLSAEMHRYVDGGEVQLGSYIRVELFRIEWANLDASPGKKGMETEQTGASSTGDMAYLVIEDLVMVGWDNRLLEMMEGGDYGIPVASEVQGRDKGMSFAGVKNGPGPRPTPVTGPKKTPEEGSGLLEAVAEADDDDDDDFEAMTVSEHRSTQRRVEIAAQISPGYAKRLESSRLPWLCSDPTKPVKLTPLKSIPNLPYKQNWSTNILAVISAITDLEPSPLPPLSQRQARLTDPSTTKHVHLTVFLDPEDFAPEIGSVVLLLGVKNHRFDGGSLKKYVSDRPKNGRSWWYENPIHLEWCDVDGLRKWWNEGVVERQA